MSTADGGTRPRAGTAYGVVEGRRQPGGTAVFRGVPYAAPPTGALRFAAPRPPAAWDGVRDAGAFGPTAPKVPYPPAFAALLSDPEIPGEDCLTVNVWTPDPDPGARLPVMVWLHGGAHTRGSSAVPVYDGSAFARDGVVLVSLNFRLGVLGYGLFPDAPANRGLLDQIAALEWVRDNITAFGGDPGRVTVFGESAGAISTGALLAAPRAAGLFARAVLQSGAPEALPREQVRTMVRRMAARLRVPATARAFEEVPLPALLSAQEAAMRRSSPVLGGPAFGLVTDPGTLPVDPLEAATASRLPLLMGWTAQEHRLWLAPTGGMRLLDRLGPLAVAYGRLRGGKDLAAVRALRAALPEASPADLAGHLVTDRLLRDPLRRIAGARRAAPSHLYEFRWPSGVPGLGACHALELGFVFDTLRAAESAWLAGPDAPQALADEMHRAWVGFATTGDPGWAPWNGNGPPKVFDGPEPEAVRAEAVTPLVLP
ncbi:carboxylesterase/lipase family protein [Streptomyces sp. NPDC048387]|uniref:carboxylesterase/lipase family protein n=1 Tax=unclassified Streptomyces TaxID=2593676 RepID=UPI0036CBFADD